ncbi:MAG: hypothetical protein C0483_14170 [Pirellula sp.]|nr:hypothetical protein [Pirellula sp.]
MATATFPASIPAKSERFLEYTAANNGGAKVDRAANVIRGVKLLGMESANGRTYTKQALEKALPMYEGAPVYFDHVKPGTERSYGDRFGEAVNVRLTPSGLIGDVKYNPDHPRAKQVLFDVENGTSKVGFSPDHYGDGPLRNGRRVVETITVVKSIDIVANPATNRSFSESTELRESALADVITASMAVGRYSMMSFAESVTSGPAVDTRQFVGTFREVAPYSPEDRQRRSEKRLRESAEQTAKPTDAQAFAKSIRT